MKNTVTLKNVGLLRFADLSHKWQTTCGCEMIASSDILVWCLGTILQNNIPGKHSNGKSMNIYNTYCIYRFMMHVSKFTMEFWTISRSRWDVEEITVLGVMHHAHLVGKRMKVEVTRDGEYIGTLDLRRGNNRLNLSEFTG